jgi:hypothetical protein
MQTVAAAQARCGDRFFVPRSPPGIQFCIFHFALCIERRLT